MRENLINLNVNPCKMCMPMGSVSAFSGIANCMTILHGSQGCSTYIRRHMATHYNEPVDIASTSLTEQGTVFGGEKSLVKGLENLITLYHPEVIGVATTCLAETIGEDIPRMIRDFYVTHPDCGAKIFTVSSSGYSGTQYEGFFAALNAIVSQTQMDVEKNQRINIITSMQSPADTRYLKRLTKDMGLDAIFLPDLSENLDGGHEAVYERLKSGGTTLADIQKMACARATIELSTFVNEGSSPAKYLFDNYGVPYTRLHLPVGLAGSDALIKALVSLGGKLTPDMLKARARYLDAMVDSHKYNSQGRAAIFGEPDIVFAAAKLCMENGIVPVVVATGAKCDALGVLLKEDIAKLADTFFVKDFIITDDCDFDSVETWAKAYGANIMIGNSDGRRIAHKLNIPLIRCGFPIHDQVGGQRVRTLGYEGSITLLDRATNELLLKTETNFREELYAKYYQEKADLPAIATEPYIKQPVMKAAAQKTATHPCFNGCGGKFARMHLPIAKACNIQCNYCVRKYDCPNESRPGVTTAILSPEGAVAKYLDTKKTMENLTVVGIAGPGDALADFDLTRETLSLLRKADPNVTVCLSTNGLMLPQYADALAALDVTHITVTMNAIDPAIGSQIYRHVTYMGQTYTGVEGASILLANQMAGIKMMAERGAVVKVNIVMMKGINDEHIKAVVEKAKELGAAITNIMQLIPVKGSAFEHLPLVTHQEMMKTRFACGEIIDQMFHCRQCRADAIGTLGEEGGPGESRKSCTFPAEVSAISPPAKILTQEPAILFAVSSKSGVLVDQHFGHATDFYIYELAYGIVRFKERRGIGGPGYCGGKCADTGDGQEDADSKMDRILRAVVDCACIVTMRIGEAPRMKLVDAGKQIHIVFGPIEQAVNDAVMAILSHMKGAV